jgi:4-amino-4-deoxy-L-arabinose transferase-like glycosyltransferase
MIRLLHDVMRGLEKVRKVSRLELLILVLVLAASLGLRLFGLDVFVVNDELRWTCRSVGFRVALAEGDWANTFRVGHPGVLTTWLGVLFASPDNAQVRAGCQASLDGRKLNEVKGSPEEQVQLLTALGQMLFAGRVGVALFTWACIVGIYFLARLLWGPRVAVLSLVLIALDPFHLALSRFLHVDAVLTGVMTLSVLSLLVSLRHSGSNGRRLTFLALSGVTCGLAILQKSPAVLLIPFSALLLALDVLRRGVRRETLLHAARDLAIWGAVVAVVFVALWPAMWVDPLGTLEQVFGKAAGYAEEGHRTYFAGRVVEDPGWLFYPVVALFRLNPLVLVGLAAGVAWMVKRGCGTGRRFGAGGLLLYGVLYGVFISLGAKKFDRYLLPVFPALELAAAIGLLWVTETALARLRTKGFRRLFWVYPLACSAVLAIQIALVLPHYPYYLTYYNPLLGGIGQAKEVLLVGWGEGYEQVAAYLNAKPDAERLQVALPAFPTFAPLFRGESRSTGQYSIWDTEYVLFYLPYVQLQRYEDLMAAYLSNPGVEPEYVVSLHGVDYAWLYRNEHYVEPVQYVEEQERPEEGECLLFNGDSLFAKHYQGALPVHGFSPTWRPEEKSYTYWSVGEMAALMDGMASECERVWYARYPEWEDEVYLDLLNVRGMLLEQASLPHVEVTLHQLAGAEAVTEPVGARFGGLRLVGYGVTDPPPGWGRDGGVVLAWEVLEKVEEDYSVFLHLYDRRGERVAQGDALIVDRELRPTSQWEAGASSEILYHLPIGAGTPPGEYELEVGVYHLETGKRLEGEGGEKSVRVRVTAGKAEGTPVLGELGVAHVVEREVIPELKLVGYGMDREAALAGQTVTVRVYWEAEGEMEEAYRLRLGLRGAGGEVYGGGEYDLVGTEYATTEWGEGEVLWGVYEVWVEEEVPTEELVLTVNLVREGGEEVLGEPVAVGSVWVQSTGRSFEEPEGIGGQEVRFGETIRLLGWEVEGEVSAGSNVDVTLYWRAEREMETGYKVFVHVYDEEGRIVAQRDWLPGLGAKPTVGWEEGEVVADRHIVAIDAGVPAGEYSVAVGLYEEGGGERLAAYGPDGGRLDQDRIILGQVKIEP